MRLTLPQCYFYRLSDSISHLISARYKVQEKNCPIKTSQMENCFHFFLSHQTSNLINVINIPPPYSIPLSHNSIHNMYPLYDLLSVVLYCQILQVTELLKTLNALCLKYQIKGGILARADWVSYLTFPFQMAEAISLRGSDRQTGRPAGWFIWDLNSHLNLYLT